MSETKTMSYNDYLKVVGILHMAHEHMKKVMDYSDALAVLVEEEPGHGGHSDDAIWQPYTADELLKKLGFTVEAKQ